MLKYFYKTFSTCILILALLNLQITPAYAQASDQNVNEESESARESIREGGGESDSGEGMQPAEGGEAGGEMASRMMSVTTEDTNIMLGDMMVFLLLIGIGAFVMAIWQYKPMSLDMKVALGASAIMVGSLLMSIFSARGEIDAGTYKIEKKEDGTVNNMQVDALREQRKSYVALRDHASRKWKIEAAGAAGYAGAAILAQMASAKLEAKTKTCMTALDTQQCPAAKSIHQKETAARWTVAPSYAKLKQRKSLIEARRKAFQQCLGPNPPETTPAAPGLAQQACMPERLHLTTLEPIQAPPPGSATEGETSFIQDSLFFSPKKSPNFVEVISLNQVLPDPPIHTGNKSDSLDAFLFDQHFSSYSVSSPRYRVPSSQVSDLFLGSAHAMEVNSKMLGLGAAAAAAFFLLKNKLKKLMDKWMANPDHRRNLYLGAAGVAGAAAAISYMSMGQAEENIKKIDKILAKLDGLQDMSKTQEKQEQQDIGLAGSLQPTDQTPSVRISDSDEGAGCPRPKENGECPSLEADIRNSKEFSGIDPKIAGLAGLTGRVADGMTGSSELDAGTMSDIDELSSQNALAKRGLRKLEEAINKKREGSERGPVDYDKESSELVSRLASVANEALSSQGSSPSKLASAMGYQPLRDESEDKVDVAEKLKEADGVASRNSELLNTPSSDDEGFSFDFGDEEEKEGEIFEGDMDEYGTEMYAKAFDIQSSKGSDQIVGDRDVSIFRVISVRYMKSGLPRLLDELSGKSSERLEELE